MTSKKTGKGSLWLLFEKIMKKAKDVYTFFLTEEKIVPKKNLDALEENLREITKQEEKSEPIVSVQLTIKSIVVFRVVWLLVYYTGYIAFKGLTIIYLILTAIIISIAMESAIRWFSRRMKRGWAIFFSYLILLIFLLLGFPILASFIIEQLHIIIVWLIDWFNQIQTTLTTYWIEGIITKWEWLPSFIKEKILLGIQDEQWKETIQKTLVTNISNIITMTKWSAGEVLNWFFIFLNWFISFLTNFSIVFVLAVLCSVEKDSIVHFFARLGSKQTREKRIHTIDTIYRKLGSWLRAQFVLCVFIWCTTWIILSVVWLLWLPIPHTGSLSLIAGLTEFVPYIWPILGMIPALLIATTTWGWVWFLVIAGVFLLIQQFENNVLVPRIMNKTLGVNPVLTFICMLIWAVALGFLGIMLAVPFAVILKLLVEGIKE